MSVNELMYLSTTINNSDPAILKETKIQSTSDNICNVKHESYKRAVYKKINYYFE
jgi:hypothetical protein